MDNMTVDQPEDGSPEVEAPTTMNVDDNHMDFDNVDPPSPTAQLDPPCDTTPSQGRRRGVEIEEVEDEDDSDFRWVANYPLPAGSVKGECRTSFEKQRDRQKAEECAPWAPFESQKEWELARWLMTSGVSQKKMDTFLKLESVRVIIVNILIITNLR